MLPTTKLKSDKKVQQRQMKKYLGYEEQEYQVED